MLSSLLRFWRLRAGIEYLESVDTVRGRETDSKMHKNIYFRLGYMLFAWGREML
jgi:hypothetical protein